MPHAENFRTTAIPRADTPDEDLRIATERSERIDAELAQQASDRKRRAEEITLLVLGQAESGKSTLTKQFQLLCSPSALDDERDSWRGPIFLCVIRAVLSIFEGHNLLYPDAFASQQNLLSSPLGSLGGGLGGAGTFPFSDASATLLELRYKLSPLLELAETLERRLRCTWHTDLERRSEPTLLFPRGWQKKMSERGVVRPLAPIIPSTSASASVASLSTTTRSGDEEDDDEDEDGDDDEGSDEDGEGVRRSNGSAGRTRTREEEERDEDLLEASTMLQLLSGDVRSLFDHVETQRMIRSRRVKLSEADHHFLSRLDRIVEPDWTPTNDDILLVRVQTTMPAEYKFDNPWYKSQKGSLLASRHRQFNVIDVGGAVYQRRVWVPYFEHSDVLLFLAPVSAFDQFLDEDREKNRFQDSLEIFEKVINHDCMRRAHIILFLNKVDVLREKLQRDIRIRDYILTYGARSNDVETALEYFRQGFQDMFTKSIQKWPESSRRQLRVFRSCAVDTAEMRGMLQETMAMLDRETFSRAALGPAVAVRPAYPALTMNGRSKLKNSLKALGTSGGGGSNESKEKRKKEKEKDGKGVTSSILSSSSSTRKKSKATAAPS